MGACARRCDSPLLSFLLVALLVWGLRVGADVSATRTLSIGRMRPSIRIGGLLATLGVSPPLHPSLLQIVFRPLGQECLPRRGAVVGKQPSTFLHAEFSSSFFSSCVPRSGGLLFA